VKVVDAPLHLGAIDPLLLMIGAVPPVRFTITLKEKEGFVVSSFKYVPELFDTL
jgi:hypothetical protein